jgi:hypothetical protein
LNPNNLLLVSAPASNSSFTPNGSEQFSEQLFVHRPRMHVSSIYARRRYMLLDLIRLHSTTFQGSGGNPAGVSGHGSWPITAGLAV